MEIGTRNKSTLPKNTPAKSNARKSTQETLTPLKRKQESVGGITKKIKFELSHLEEECKKAYAENIPSIVLSMGSGDTGQLGLGEDVMEKKRPTEITDLKDIIAIRAGGMHSVCLSKTGKVYTFGCNDEGALGRPIVEDEEATVPGMVELPDDIVVTDITAGDNHSSVLTTDGRVYIWGSFRDNNGLIGMLKPFEKLLVPTAVPTDKKIIKIASGENHFAMLTDSGDILTFGCAEQGQLGRISPNNLVRGGRGGLTPLLTPGPVRVRHSVKFCDMWAGAFCTVGKSIDGDVFGCGLNNYRQLGLHEDLVQLMMTNLIGFNELGESWRAFSFGQHHTIALTQSNRAFVIGRGEYGSLGQGNNEHCVAVTAVNVAGDIRAVAACNRTSYALMADGAVYSWGMGSSYQLGHGDDEDVNLPTKMVGKQIADKKVVEISPGFQHVLFRAVPQGDDNEVPQVAAAATEEPVVEEPCNQEAVTAMDVQELTTECDRVDEARHRIDGITEENNIPPTVSDADNNNVDGEKTELTESIPTETVAPADTTNAESVPITKDTNNGIVEEEMADKQQVVVATIEQSTEKTELPSTDLHQMEVDDHHSEHPL